MTAVTSAAELLRTVPMPSRIRALPRNRVGYPIPFFAATIDGERDFRVGDPDAYRACVLDRACWVCGQRRKAKEHAFVIGPMCAVNRTSQDPPCHVECAEYAAKVCPFMVRPNMVRRERGLPDTVGNAGIAIQRNPGACLIWVAKDFKIYEPSVGGGYGVLLKLGDPLATSWWAHGRPATRDEVVESMRTGLPLLEAECDHDEDPEWSRKVLQRQYEQALRYLPAA